MNNNSDLQINSLELEELFSDCCHEPAIYNIVPWKGGLSLDIREICFKCLKCAEFGPEIKDPKKELQFKKLSNKQYEFIFNELLYYVTIEGPGTNKTLSHPLICLDIFEGKESTAGKCATSSYNFDNIHDLEHELHYSQDLGPQLSHYIVEQVKKGGLINA